MAIHNSLNLLILSSLVPFIMVVFTERVMNFFVFGQIGVLLRQVKVLGKEINWDPPSIAGFSNSCDW